ncbi:U3 small nucleolar RNA-associated protein 11 [Rhizodiscina lignyota]|uniref:U3 small nucleolar RNA-associated protein 11 n=1 Tax=Rhizodiscina lignyota TaxID=1504668 RepID=A0A9P4M8E9_9PEZI|nr:U3 small nucleolar RNA-associated protein 11 [Rhizodiscina lignyota]
MSSLRNAVQRRNHRERAQPAGREKLGLLEKHSDYSLRARDFAEKKKRLKILRQKAANRNPDEFAFGMMSTKTVKGEKIGDRGNKALSQEAVKLMKTQDAGYLRTMLQATKKERERLESEIQLLENEEDGAINALKGGGQGKHTVFVDDVEAQREFDAEEFFDTDAKGLSMSFNRPKHHVDHAVEATSEIVPRPRSKKAIQAEQEAEKEGKRQAKRRLKGQEGRLGYLEKIKAQERDLEAAERELEVQRAKMNNSVGGVNKNGVKFRIRERKR